jgi:choline kinase
MLRRLVASPHGNCVLLDSRVCETDGRWRLAARAGRVARIAPALGPEWDVCGESAGLFKVDATGGACLHEVLDREVAAGRLDQEHEAVLDQVFALAPFGFERVDDLPWTAIDLPQDVAKAEKLAHSLDPRQP